MKYSSRHSLAPAGTALTGVQVYSCNGLFDPDITGTGHQPRGFDQLMTLYDHYVAIMSSLNISITSHDDTESYIVGVAIRDSATISNDPLDYLEGGYVRFTTIAPSDGGGARVIKYNINPNKWLGRSKPMSDPDLKGTTAANPTEQCYFHIFVSNTNPTSGIGNGVTFLVNIAYNAVLIEPKVVASS